IASPPSCRPSTPTRHRSAQLLDQPADVAQHPPLANAALRDPENGGPDIRHEPTRRADAEQLAPVRAGVGQPGRHRVALGNQFLHAVVEVGERPVTPCQVPLEPVPSADRHPERAAERQPFRQQLVRQREVPTVPQLLVIAAHQGLVFRERHRHHPVGPPAERSKPASRAVSRSFTRGQSSRTTLYVTLSRTRPPCVIMCERRTPSCTAPSFSMAACDRVLRTSVQSDTRFSPSTSKACASSNSLHSGLTGVPHTSGTYHVEPISTRRCWGTGSR